MTDMELCDAEIAKCEAYLLHGGPDEIGAYVGLTDWQGERALLVTERDQ